MPPPPTKLAVALHELEQLALTKLIVEVTAGGSVMVKVFVIAQLFWSVTVNVYAVGFVPVFAGRLIVVGELPDAGFGYHV